MAAIDGWIDVFRTGRHTDSRGYTDDYSEADLDSWAAHAAHADPAPAVYGHPENDAPAYGWVSGVRRVGDRLQVRFRDLAQEFRDSLESGAYAGRSIALMGCPCGHGATLRHVGFLGAARPAVAGLAPTQFTAEPDRVIDLPEFAAAGDEGMSVRLAMRTMARMWRAMREHLIDKFDVATADAVAPDYEIGQVQDAGHLPADAGVRMAATAGREPGGDEPAPGAGDTPPKTIAGKTTFTGGTTMTGDELAKAEEELAKGRAELDRREAQFAAREAEAVRDEHRRKWAAKIQEHVQAGRVLPAESAEMAAFASALPREVVAFAAPDGSARQVSPSDWFEAFLAGLPTRGPDLKEYASGGAPADPSDGDVVERAKEIRREARQRGAFVSAGEAITRAEREVKRGAHS